MTDCGEFAVERTEDVGEEKKKEMRQQRLQQPEQADIEGPRLEAGHDHAPFWVSVSLYIILKL